MKTELSKIAQDLEQGRIDETEAQDLYWVYWVLANRFLLCVKMTITDVIYGCAAKTQLKKQKR